MEHFSCLIDDIIGIACLQVKILLQGKILLQVKILLLRFITDEVTVYIGPSSKDK